MMLKRLALAGASMLLVLLALLVYQLVQQTGPDAPGPAPRPPVAPLTETDPEPTLLDAGAVDVGAVERPHFVARDEQGRVVREFGFARRLGQVEGLLEVSEPWLRLYAEDERVVEMRAARGQVPIESAAGQVQLPQHGRLEDGVTVTVYRLAAPTAARGPEAAAPERLPELTLEVEDVEFQLAYSRLQSAGPVTAHAPDFELSGVGLGLQYDQQHNRLRVLELRRLDRLRLRESAFVGERRPGAGRGPADEAESAAPAADAPELLWYRLALRDNVHIRQGDDALRADEINMLIGLEAATWRRDAEQPGATQPGATVDDAPASAPTGADEDWVEVTTAGPLRLTALAGERDAVIPEPGADRLQMTAAGAPAKLVQAGATVVTAPIMHYGHPSGQVTLEGRGEDAVWLSLGTQGQVSAARVNMAQPARQVQMTGPGELALGGADDADDVSGHYGGAMTLTFAELPDLAAGLDSAGGQEVRAVEFDGGIALTATARSLSAERGQLLFYPGAGSPAERLERVQMAGAVRAAEGSRRFHGEYVRLDFHRAGAGPAQPARLYAEGDVYAETEDYLFEAAERLTLTFAAGEAAAELPPHTDEPRLLAGQQVGEVRAVGPAGGVRFVDQQRGLEIRGDEVRGDAAAGRWQIVGEPAEIRGLSQEGLLTGPLIVLDERAGTCLIAGAGAMAVATTRGLGGEPLDEPAPLAVAWRDGATYSMAGEQVTFQNATVTMEQTHDGFVERQQLDCPTLVVHLEQVAEETAPAVGDSFSGEWRLASLTADGAEVSVRAERRPIGAAEPQRRMRLVCDGIAFDRATGVIATKSGGWLELVETSPTTLTPSPRRSVDTLLARGLTGADPTYTLVRFGEQLLFDQVAGKLRLTGGVSLDRVPLDADRPAVPTQLLHTDGLLRLDCDRIIIDIAESEAARTDLARLRAEGNVFVETVSSGRTHFFVAAAAELDNSRGRIRFDSSETLPVRFDQLPFRWVDYHLDTGAFEAAPWGPGELATTP